MIYLISNKAKKFKNNAIKISIPLQLNMIEEGMIICNLLRNGYDNIKNTHYLQELYGVFFDVYLTSNSKRVFINFYIEFINNMFTFFGENIEKEIIEFLFKMIRNKLISESQFQEEKKKLIYDIFNMEDNKEEYIIQKSIKICSDNYGFYEYGDFNKINSLTLNTIRSILEKTYKQELIYIFLDGDLEKELIKEHISNVFEDSIFIEESLFNVENKYLVNNKYEIDYKFKEIYEYDNSNEGKIILCIKACEEIKYYQYIVLKNLLKISVFTKLRLNEKLVYYCDTYFDENNELIIISISVDSNNIPKVKKELLIEIKKIIKGEIYMREVNSSLLKTSNEIRSIMDSEYQCLDLISRLYFNGENYDLNDIENKITMMNGADIKRLCKQMQIRLIYCLV